MARRDEINSSLSIDADWVDAAIDGPVREVNMTMCRLLIKLNGNIVTRHSMDNGARGDRVEFPAYYLAEWFAKHWWAIFHEPEKSDSDYMNVGFRNRHWFGAARNGFALPDMWLLPTGDSLQIEASETSLPACRISFTESAEGHIRTISGKRAASAFIRDVIQHIDTSSARAETALHEYWRLIEQTKPEEEAFCTLKGMLGLSPYDEHEDIERALDSIDGLMPFKIIQDICEASTPESFVPMTRIVGEAFSAMRESGYEVDLSSFPARPGAADIAPWKWGKQAAAKLRERLGLSSLNRDSGEQFFTKINVDAEHTASLVKDSEVSEIDGAVERRESGVRIAVMRRRDMPQRRFASARAVFMAWGTDEQDTARLITHARTREQQASRAFAAELLAPIDFIRKAAGSGPISHFRINAIADELGVSPWVVAYQAQNHNVRVANYE
jgi:hypothetical protein